MILKINHSALIKVVDMLMCILVMPFINVVAYIEENVKDEDIQWLI